MNLDPGPAPDGRKLSVAGREFHLIEMGEGAPLFLLHGGGPGCTAWSDFGVVARMFARNRRCIMPDLLQYGRSDKQVIQRSEEHTSELQSLMRISYAVFCLKKKKYNKKHTNKEIDNIKEMNNYDNKL